MHITTLRAIIGSEVLLAGPSSLIAIVLGVPLGKIDLSSGEASICCRTNSASVAATLFAQLRLVFLIGTRVRPRKHASKNRYRDCIGVAVRGAGLCSDTNDGIPVFDRTTHSGALAECQSFLV